MRRRLRHHGLRPGAPVAVAVGQVGEGRDPGEARGAHRLRHGRAARGLNRLQPIGRGPGEDGPPTALALVAQVPAWLQADHDQLTAKVLRRPERAEIAAPVQEQLIVELYSK